MRGTFRALFGASLAVMALAAPTNAQQSSDTLPTIESKTEGMTRIDGFIPIYWEANTAKIWLEVGRWGQDILHYTSLPAGLGQNDIGLNRGDLGPSAVIQFERVGRKVFMHEHNLSYRADSDDPLEVKSVKDGFPSSILWGWDVTAETGDRVLVDATSFFMRDAHGVAQSLQRGGQGTFRLDNSRSTIFLDRTRGFPTNTEVELTLTFTSDSPGGLVRSVTPTASALTVREHHSFVELPALGSYTPREFDPRAGYGSMSYMDFAAPIAGPIRKQFIRRHKLEKQNPNAAMSPAVEPIIYYLDPGTPEPVRTALLEGGAWWNQAFEAAGYQDAFQMRMLPADADPMDARYNVVQWVHRSTRGWSYGNSITDPRTGEILKGHVTLGSLRVRQDHMIGEGLTSPYNNGDEDPQDILDMSLLRINQLSAHEIGHTIGLSHNYIASAQRDAGDMSVMDYPHPRITLGANGQINVTEAYDRAIGEWDKVAIRFGYSDFADGTDETAALEEILQDGIRRGVTFMTDTDARAPGSAHPDNHLWDNGADVTVELNRMMDVRRVALDQFDISAIKMGDPLATMEEALVPLYLHHRYQLEATSKVIGGQYYTYALRGDGQEPLRSVPAAMQMRALDGLMRTLDPEELKIPEQVLEILPPRPPGFGGSAELFRRWTGLVFDAISPAASVADATLGFLLQDERAARMVQQSALDASQPGLGDVFDRLWAQLYDAPTSDAYAAEIQRTVQRAYVDQLMVLAARAGMPQVRAMASYELQMIHDRLDGRQGDRNSMAADYMAMQDIERFLDRDMEPISSPGLPSAPPGSPIGQSTMEWLLPYNGGWLVSADDGLMCSWW